MNSHCPQGGSTMNCPKVRQIIEDVGIGVVFDEENKKKKRDEEDEGEEG